MLAEKKKSEVEKSPLAAPIPDAADLLALCRAEGPCITIFLGPHLAGSGSRPSGTLLKAMLPQVESALEDCGMHPQDAAALVNPLQALSDNPRFLGSHSDSLCVFRAPGALRCFSARAALETGWHAEERFLIPPIVDQLGYRQSFLLLSLAGKHIRLLRCENGDVSVMPIPDGVPESAAEFIGDLHGEEHTKNHASGVKFGASDGREKSGRFRREFMTAIDHGLQPVFRALRLPLVLAGVAEETAAYAAVSGYPDLVDERVQLSPDGGVTDEELVQAAAQILQRWSNAAEKQAVAEYEHAAAGRRVNAYAEILQAATEGKVQHLFVERDRNVTGNAQRLTGRGPSEGYVYRNGDLLNAAVVEVLLHRGMVWLLEPEKMPEAVVMAAVLRYANDKNGGE